jgi:Molecular chaperone (small heat shock protein)
MNALSLFTPTFNQDVFDMFDRNFGTSVPNIDVRETNEAYVMDMDLPGRSEKDVEISLKDRVLTISSLEETKTEEKKNTDDACEYLIRERRSSSFSRRFTLPADIDAGNVEANFKNGVLTITIPRRPEAQARQILIKSA